LKILIEKTTNQFARILARGYGLVPSETEELRDATIFDGTSKQLLVYDRILEQEVYKTAAQLAEEATAKTRAERVAKALKMLVEIIDQATSLADLKARVKAILNGG